MTMTIADALLYSLLGMIIVFFALVLLILIIGVMNVFTQKKAAAPAPASAAAAAVAEPVYAPGTAGELKLYDTDERVAAMIMAIVANDMDAPLNELRFKSIRELK